MKGNTRIFYRKNFLLNCNSVAINFWYLLITCIYFWTRNLSNTFIHLQVTTSKFKGCFTSYTESFVKLNKFVDFELDNKEPASAGNGHVECTLIDGIESKVHWNGKIFLFLKADFSSLFISLQNRDCNSERYLPNCQCWCWMISYHD